MKQQHKTVNLYNKLLKKYGDANVIKISPEEMRVHKLNIGDRIEKVTITFIDDE